MFKHVKTVFAVFILTLGWQAAANQHNFAFINLKPVANMGFADKRARDKTGGWFDQGPQNDLSPLKPGVHTFNGIPFKIIDPKDNSGKSCIVLRARTLSYLPLDSGPIKVANKAELIYFLTACGWNTSIGNEVAFITVRYKQPGLYLDIPVRFKQETGGWWKPEPIQNGEIAWRGQNHSAEVGLFSFGWINPYPDQEIDTVTFVSTNSSSVPAIIAATMVTSPAEAATLKPVLEGKLQTMKAGQKNPAKATLQVDFDAPAVPVSNDAASLALGFSIRNEYFIASKALVDAGKGKPFFRFQICLAEPSPAEGVWDFTRLDQYVDYINAAGGEPMLCFGPGGPIWMATPMAGVSLRRNWKPADLEEYAKYCEAIVHHYNIERKTPVKWWQIGNETELKGWSYKYYVKVYNYIAPRLKKIDPTIRIGGPVNCSPNIGWAGELLREAGTLVDFLSYHQYGYSEPFDSPTNYVMSKTKRYQEAVSSYLKQTQKLLNGRMLPVIVTESNTNPRYQRPEGTDPRIRTMFNAAWYMSALCRFVIGGGRSMCYFTLDGGFGACCFVKGKFTLHPVYHSIWLFRKLGTGQIMPVKTSTPFVEAYAFRDGNKKRFILINKLATPVEVSLNVKASQAPGKGIEYRLNSSTAKACAHFNRKQKIKTLTPTSFNWHDATTTLTLSGNEVMGWESK